MTFEELALKVLSQAKEPLTTKQIWERACELGLDKELSSTGKTPWASIGARLYLSIKNGENQFIQVSTRPATFWLKARENESGDLKINDARSQMDIKNGDLKIMDIKNNEQKAGSFDELDLHPLLAKYLAKNPNFKLSCKTFRHEASKKGRSGEDKWSYPDIVGVYFPYKDYEAETLNLLEGISQTPYKLFSFELKKKLNFSNLKESYFQAVSNSSWANEGYLVAFEIEDEVLSELRRLNQSFGIGVIKLESDVLNSKILLNSRQKELDIQTLDMLIEKNPKFKEHIKDICKQIKAGKDTKVLIDFDKVLDDAEMEKHKKEKHIK